MRVDLAPGKSDLAGMTRKLRAKGKQNLRVGPINNRNEHRCRPGRLYTCALPQQRIEIEVAPPCFRGMIGERRRDFEAQSRAHAIEEVAGEGLAIADRHVHQARSSMQWAGAIAKNRPADTT